jgi:hypothetical protein
MAAKMAMMAMTNFFLLAVLKSGFSSSGTEAHSQTPDTVRKGEVTVFDWSIVPGSGKEHNSLSRRHRQ